MATLTALYDTRGAAETARDELVALGLSSGDITIRGNDDSATAGRDSGGFWSGLKDLFVPDEDQYAYDEGVRRGGHLLIARVPAELEEQAYDVLERSGAVDLDERAQSWRQSGWTGDQSGATGSAERAGSYETEGLTGSTATGLGTGSARDEEVIPIAEEQLEVGKREVGGGRVRVRSYVTERPVEEQVNLRQEHVTIERRPVNRELRAGDAAFEEKTIEAVERGEEAVVSKTAQIVEEVALRKEVDTRTETVSDTVRRQEVEVEDDRGTTPDGRATGPSTTTPRSR